MKITIKLANEEEVEVLDGFIELRGSPVTIENLPNMTEAEKVAETVDIISKELKQSYIRHKLKVPTKDLQDQVVALADSITIT